MLAAAAQIGQETKSERIGQFDKAELRLRNPFVRAEKGGKEKQRVYGARVGSSVSRNGIRVDSDDARCAELVVRLVGLASVSAAMAISNSPGRLAPVVLVCG